MSSKFKTTLRAQSGHTLFVKAVDKDELPELEHADKYTKFYIVKNWTADGVVFFYLASGNKQAPKQVVVWYAKTKSFYAGYGLTIKQAIDRAQQDGWMHA